MSTASGGRPDAPFPRHVRSVAVVALAALLALVGCTTAPGDRTSYAVATATPATSTTRPATPQELAAKEVVARLDSAVRKGDRATFLATFATTPALRRTWGRWFDNIRRIPFSHRELRIVRSRQQLPAPTGGAFSVDVAFRHQVSGADRGPVDEWYRLRISTKGAASPRVVAMGGTPSVESTKLDYGYRKWEQLYPGPWDLDEVAVVSGRSTVLIGPASLKDTMRGAVGRADRAAASVKKLLGPAGASPLPKRWTISVAPSDRNPSRYFGGCDCETAKVAPDGMAAPAFASIALTDGEDHENPPPATRIVIAADALQYPDTLAHEMAHGVAASWAKGTPERLPTWFAEGLAVYVEVRADPGVRESIRRRSHDAVKDTKELPEWFDWSEQDEVLEDYAISWAAIETIASSKGGKAMLGCVRTGYTTDDLESALDRCGVRSEAALFAQTKKWVARH